MTHSRRLTFSKDKIIKLTRDDPQPPRWRDFLEEVGGNLKGEWIYKGINGEKANEDNVELPIESSFDREWSNIWIKGGAKDQWKKQTPWDFRWAHEADLLREFKRAAHHFRIDLPPKTDFLEWLSLGRHFEMPCRLVDFSYSFWVAAYFALSGKGADRDGYILALSLDWLNKNIESLHEDYWLGRNPSASKSEYLKSPEFSEYDYHNPAHFHRFAFTKEYSFNDVVVPVCPGRKNERLIAQQGLFLCQGDISLTFSDALRNTLENATKKAAMNKVIRLIVLPSKWRSFILGELKKTNIKGSVLFPDLQGFSQSLRDNFHTPITKETSDRFISELKKAISGTPWF